MNKFLFFLIILIFAIFGITTAVLRHFETGIPFLPGKKSAIWSIEAKLEFDPKKDEAITVDFSLPDFDNGYEILKEFGASNSYGFEITHDKSRRAIWTKRSASKVQTIYYKIEVKKSQKEPKIIKTEPKINKIIWNELDELASYDLRQKAYEKSSSELSFTRELIKIVNSYKNSQNLALLLEKHNKLEILQKVLADANIASRVPKGLFLEDKRRNLALVDLLEVFADGRWVRFDHNTAKEGSFEEFFLWHSGDGAVVDLIGGKNANLSFSMIKQNISSEKLAYSQISSDQGFGLFSINTLPIEEQGMFKLLLLLPIGALITVFMRIVIGVRTSGTFMPVLIAMAFLQTELITALVSFVLIVALGLLIRGYLSSMNLLLTARIATIIVIVIFLVGAISLLGYKFGFNTGMTVAFFPIIILAWTIERMSILWEEEGRNEVLIQGGNSLFVALLAYLAMSSIYIEHWFFNFPELNLLVVAIIMLLGRYTGYRLLELRRFRELV